MAGTEKLLGDTLDKDHGTGEEERGLRHVEEAAKVGELLGARGQNPRERAPRASVAGEAASRCSLSTRAEEAKLGEWEVTITCVGRPPPFEEPHQQVL